MPKVPEMFAKMSTEECLLGSSMDIDAHDETSSSGGTGTTAPWKGLRESLSRI